ncbi:sugar ABC transporter permease [Acidaminobacter sp. JC074]|nr:sugar ABC transporter permease [Acidaminobacter sp. JC074]
MKKAKRQLKIMRDNWQLYVMALPIIIWFVLFIYKPLTGQVIAFQDYSLFKGIAGSEWVGLDNFVSFLTGPYFWPTFRNTLMLSLYGLVFEFPAAIILALMLNEVKNKIFKTSVQTATFIPYFVSIVVTAGIVTNILAPDLGIVNLLLERLGFEKIYFLMKPELFRGIFTGMNIWKETGFNAIVYLAALMAIDPALYEAARVDGANKFQQMRHVTIPGIMPTIIIMFILRIGQMLNIAFEKVLLLQQPATYETSQIISTYVYQTGLQNQDFGLATAAEVFNAIVALILVYSANRIASKFSDTSLW